MLNTVFQLNSFQWKLSVEYCSNESVTLTYIFLVTKNDQIFSEVTTVVKVRGIIVQSKLSNQIWSYRGLQKDVMMATQ